MSSFSAEIDTHFIGGVLLLSECGSLRRESLQSRIFGGNFSKMRLFRGRSLKMTIFQILIRMRHHPNAHDRDNVPTRCCHHMGVAIWIYFGCSRNVRCWSFQKTQYPFGIEVPVAILISEKTTNCDVILRSGIEFWAPAYIRRRVIISSLPTVMYEISGRSQVESPKKSDTDDIAPISWDELTKIKHRFHIKSQA
jgi:hypothetical protein